jgi:zinc protease
MKPATMPSRLVLASGFGPLAVGLRALAFGLGALVALGPSLARAQPTAASSAPRGPEASTPSGVFARPPRVERLPNGLTVISVPWDSPGIVAYYTLVRVGSRDEVEPGHSGFAHLFEHMMFRGTERFPQDRYEETIQSFGADNNAYTTQDFTLYTVTAPSSALARVVELEADRFQHLRYDEDTFRTETGAVRGEYDTSASNPLLKMWEALSELSFGRHTYGHTTLGYLRDIDAMPGMFAYSQSFFRRFYTPDDTTVIVAGDVEHAALMALVRERYGAWRGRRDQPRVPAEPEPSVGATRHIEWPAEASPRIVLGYRTPAFVRGRSERERRAALRESAALQVVHGLAFGESSPLYQRLVVQERRLLELESWSGEFSRDPHLFVAMATLAEGQSFEAILGAIQGELARFGAGGAEPARVEAVKSHLRYGLLGELDTPTAVADLVARTLAVGDDLASLDQYLAELAAVTPEDVARVAQQYLTEARRFVVTLAPAPAEPPQPPAQDASAQRQSSQGATAPQEGGS